MKHIILFTLLITVLISGHQAGKIGGFNEQELNDENRNKISKLFGELNKSFNLAWEPFKRSKFDISTYHVQIVLGMNHLVIVKTGKQGSNVEFAGVRINETLQGKVSLTGIFYGGTEEEVISKAETTN